MKRFTPYIIHHVQLKDVHDLLLPAGNHYVVIWRGKIPLGHVWLDKESPDRDSIAAAVGPALKYYAGGPGDGGGPEDPGGGMGGGLFETGGGEPGERAGSGLSVVICTRNRPESLERCIWALQEGTDKDFELVIVDNAPDDDRTERIVGKFPSVCYVKEERKGLDIARNTGARMASQPIIAYTDDDVIVGKDWVGQIKAAFTDPLTMAVTGLVIPAELRTASQYIFERYWGFNKGYLPKTFDHRYFMDNLPTGVPVWDIGAGANMAFRRDVFDLAGWFDERLDVGASGCSGDSEFWYRILAEGWNCRYLPHIVVYHQHRETVAGLRSQLFYYMRGHVSAALVQYERYGHEGDLRRLYRGLPQYYLRRIKDYITGKARENSGTLIREIGGCISGWRFYRRVRVKSEAKPFAIGGGLPLATGGRLPEAAGDRLREMADGGLREAMNETLAEVVISPQTLVSVVIPCYNHGRFLGAAIQSVLDQTHTRTEIIVVDDGSTDDTALVTQRYPSARYVRVERVGPSAARNIGVQYSKGEFVLFLDADDLLYPNAIELNLFYFGLYKNAAFVSGGHDRVDEQGNFLPGQASLVKAGDNYWALLQGNYIAMEATVLYRRELFFRFHFDTAIRACEDYDLNLQIARHYPVFGHTQKLAAYRIHTENRSHDRGMMFQSAMNALKKQEKLLRTEEERQAFRLGVENWYNFYSPSTGDS